MRDVFGGCVSGTWFVVARGIQEISGTSEGFGNVLLSQPSAPRPPPAAGMALSVASGSFARVPLGVVRPRARRARSVLASATSSWSASSSGLKRSVSGAVVRPMLPGDLAPVVATLVEASDPSKVSANALAVYALDASQARPTAEVALVASMAPSPLDTREEVVGVVGVLIDDVLKPREMRLSGANAAYVTNLAVASRARRKGIASDLLHEAEVFAKNAGCQTIWCRVDAGNTLARQMYERRGYAPREPVRLLRYRKTVATAYLVAGMAHFFDFVAGPSALPIAAGAPEFAAMSAAQQTLALLWCFTGPLAFFANVWSEKTNEPRIATAGLVVYGVFETSIAGLCAYVFGAKGGDAVTGAVFVQLVVFLCYQVLAPGAQGEKITLAKDIPSPDEADEVDSFVSMFIRFSELRTEIVCKASGDDSHADSTNDDIRWNTLSGDPRIDDGWVGDVAEPQPGSVENFDDKKKEEYERDDAGRMVYAARGFFYDGIVPSDFNAYGITERVKVDVGIVGKKRQRKFALRKRLGIRNGVVGKESDIITVTMERPLGIVVERDTEGYVRVADFVEGSRAGRAAAVQKLQGLNQAGAQAPKKGDVVRAFTTTTLSYGPRAQLLGDLSGTKRAVVLFGADDQPWGKTIGALKNGLVLDGPVTLILERERDVERAVAWIAEGTPAEKPTRQLKKKTQTRIETATDATGSRETTGASRDSRVSSISSANAPDPLNAAFAAAGISFVLLIVAGFS